MIARMGFSKIISIISVLLIMKTFFNINNEKLEDKEPEYEYLKHNIWALEEDYLKTPFFDIENSRCEIDYKFKHFESPNEASKEIFSLPDQESNEKIYHKTKNYSCLIFGTDLLASKQEDECVCKENLNSKFSGPNCGIPGSVWKIHKDVNQFPLREFGRHVVMGIPVNFELDLTEIRVKQLNEVVDVFFIVESNMTQGGDSKPLYFYDAFKKGFLCEFQSKILYSFIDYFPKEYIDDGWLVEDAIHNHLSKSVLKRIKNLKDEDLLLAFDADDILKMEVVQFLRFHDGFKNPIRFNERWSKYFFYWQHIEHTSPGMSCTIDFLKDVCDGEQINLRRRGENYQMKKNAFKGAKADGDAFEIGVRGDYAGHHCSWCSTPEGLSVKLRSAIHNDFPRWGDYPEKLKLDYIQDIMYKGLWFDGSNHVRYITKKEDPDYAPKFVLDNFEKYQHLLIRQTNNPILTYEINTQ